jgi:molybdopterin-guanine dinucleotide biosynthesis protein A
MFNLNYNQNMLSLVIQAGGESRRMGQDKALIPFLGRTLIERVLDRVSHLGDEILITTNKPERYRFLELPLIPDVIPGRGALGGLYTALNAASEPLVAVVACDMPFANAKLLTAERDLLIPSKSTAAVIPRTESGTEPFHAVYRRKNCLPAIRAALEADKWRVDSWFSAVNLHIMASEEIKCYDPNRLAFRNVNTPEELHEAERIVSSKSD